MAPTSPRLRSGLLGALFVCLSISLASCATATRMAAVGSGSPVCFRWKPAPPAPSPLAGELRPALFTEGEFRLGSHVFVHVPKDGYPIQFRPDGSVTTEHLAGVDRWRIGSGNSLELLTGSGSLVQEFRYDDRCGTLAAQIQQPEGLYTIEISRVR